MSVIPMPTSAGSPRRRTSPPPPGEARIDGLFRSPRGGAGTVTGWFRLGRFVSVSDRLFAVGVFTGELVDASGSLVGIGSRRHSAAATLSRTPDGLVALVGPVAVDLLGLTVDVAPFAVSTRRTAAVARTPGIRRAPARGASHLSQVRSTTASDGDGGVLVS